MIAGTIFLIFTLIRIILIFTVVYSIGCRIKYFLSKYLISPTIYNSPTILPFLL